MAFRLESSAFKEKQKIPKPYTGEGQDISPPLRWSDVPEGTRELAILCEDPDAPQDEPWVHWIAYKIPADREALPEGLPHEGEIDEPVHLIQGLNSFAGVGYGGPLPPKRHGRHRYFFKLYALDQPIKEIPGIDKKTFSELIKGHVIGEAQLMGTYERH